MRVRDINFNSVLLDEKIYKNIYRNVLIYEVSYKTFMVSKPLRFRLDKINGFLKIIDEIRYLVLLDYERYDEIYNRSRYLISKKSGITDSINHNFVRIKIHL